MVEVTFLGNLSRKLASSNISLSQIPPSILGPPHQSQVDRPFPQFNGVTIIAPPIGRRRTTMPRWCGSQKRYSHGLNIGANYTWSQILHQHQQSGQFAG